MAASHGHDSFAHLANAHLQHLTTDFLSNIGVSCSREDKQQLVELFGDVKFFVVGDSVSRITQFAHRVAAELQIRTPFGYTLSPIGINANYTLFKVGAVLVAHHGMGVPSALTLLHEVTKLLEYADAHDVVYIRMGASGGITVAPGTVVLTTEALNNQLEPFQETAMLGRRVQRRAVCSADVTEEIAKAAMQLEIPVVVGKTLTCDDFYETQARLDGAICEFAVDEKLQFLETCAAAGIKNIDMDARAFASFCHRLRIPVAVACVVTVNRLYGDQTVVSGAEEDLREHEDRPGRVVLQYIKTKLEAKKRD